MLQRCRKIRFLKMCKNFPKPTHALHVMRLFESSLQFIVVSNSNMRRSVAALLWCTDSRNNVYAWCLLLWAQNRCYESENQRFGPYFYATCTLCQNEIKIYKNTHVWIFFQSDLYVPRMKFWSRPNYLTGQFLQNRTWPWGWGFKMMSFFSAQNWPVK